MDEMKRLAEYARDFSLNGVSEEVLAAARYCVLDSVGSALGATRDGEIPSLVEEIERWASKSDGRNAAVWGQGRRSNVFSALMLNGVMGHALELDDVHTESKSHVGAVVVATAWTLADALGADGRRFLEAVVVGYEVMARVGMAMDVSSNRRRGWHTTGIIGPFAAAAAAGVLLKLEKERMLSAFGIAGTQSSGLWAFLAEGATCKKLHPARAAVNGLSAAILARGGMTGPAHILDAEDGGLYRAVSDSFDMSVLTDGLGERYEILRMDKKPYPCCRTTHHAIDAALAARERPGFAPERIRRVTVDTYDVGVLQCGFTNYPRSGVEAKFSIPFACAAAFVCGRVTQAQFSSDVLNDPLVRRIAESTEVKSDPLFTERYPKRWGSRMTVLFDDEAALVHQVDDMSGSAAVPLSSCREREKFLGSAETAFGAERAFRLMDAILSIDSQGSLPDLA